MEPNLESHSDLKEEISAMFAKDQEVRKIVGSGGEWNDQIDMDNTKRAKEIIAQMGYPTISKVGEVSSNQFWFLIQHADHDLDFQKECMVMLKSLPIHEVNQGNIAYLEDRIRVAEGRPTLYGTQFRKNPETGKLEPCPIEDAEHLDERRIAVGLDPFEEYEKHMLNR